MAAAETTDVAEETGAAVPAAALPRVARATGVAQRGSAPPVPRPGVIQAFRSAARPADIRGDIAAFPAVVTRSRAVWLPALLVAAGGIVLMVPGLRENSIGILAAQLLVVPPPLIPAFLAGMLAPRAAWLCGAIVGLFAGVLFAVYVLTAPSSGSVPITPELRTQAFFYAVTVSPIFGLATGTFAGFYRRFLRVASPQPPKQGGKGGGRR